MDTSNRQKTYLTLIGVRIARFFLVQTFQAGKNITNYHEIYQAAINYTKWHKIFQIVIKYTNIYYSKALQNLPKFGIFGLKTNHLATLIGVRIRRPSAIVNIAINYMYTRGLL
jgi:hypothetical protein